MDIEWACFSSCFNTSDVRCDEALKFVGLEPQSRDQYATLPTYTPLTLPPRRWHLPGVIVCSFWLPPPSFHPSIGYYDPSASPLLLPPFILEPLLVRERRTFVSGARLLYHRGGNWRCQYRSRPKSLRSSLARATRHLCGEWRPALFRFQKPSLSFLKFALGVVAMPEPCACERMRTEMLKLKDGMED